MSDGGSWHRSETFKSLAAVCVEGLTVLVLINGGAGTAVRTYLRNLTSKENPAPPQQLMTSSLQGIFGLLLSVTFAIGCWAAARPIVRHG
jgi:hypothetical protein